MTVGLVRNVGLSAVALLALGLAGCDDNPLEFEAGVAVLITTNPSVMTLKAGTTGLLESRAVDEGSRPTFDDITWSLDATCGPAQPSLAVAADNEPEIIPPGRFDVTAGDVLGETCVILEGGGVTASVAMTILPGDPVLSTISPASGDLGQVITLTGEQFWEQTAIVVDGVESPFPPTLISSTELTFLLPANVGLATVGISVGDATPPGESPGVRSEELAYTSVAGFTNGPNEPGNDGAGGAVAATLPLVANDGVNSGDVDDFYVINFASATTVTAVVDWDDAGTDVDFFITDAGLSTTCVSFYSKPEGTTCDAGGDGSVGAGDNFFIVEWFSGPDAVYSIVVK